MADAPTTGVISASTHSHSKSAPSPAARRRLCSDGSTKRGSAIRTSRRTLLSTAVRTGTPRACQIRVDGHSARQVTSASPLAEDVLRDRLGPNQPPILGPKVDQGTRTEAKSVPHRLRDGHLALLRNRGFHTLKVVFPTPEVKLPVA